jgi:hypothetical protein
LGYTVRPCLKKKEKRKEKKEIEGQGIAVHTCNLSYLILRLRFEASPGKELERPYLKKTSYT